MHIGMLCHNFLPHPGGLEVVVAELARELARDHRVTIVSSSWPDGPRRERDGDITIHRLPSLHVAERFGVPYPIPLGLGIGEARAALRDVDVLHTHGALYANTFLARRLAARWGRPLVLTEHVGFVPYPLAVLNRVQSVAWRTLGDAAVHAASSVATMSGRVWRWLAERYPERRAHLIPNGVDFNRFSPLEESEIRRARAEFGLPLDVPLALFVGRAAAKKNIDLALSLDRTGYTLVVCGAARVGLPDDVIDLGVVPRDRMARLHGCVSLLLHVASGEGFPMAVQEAMACATPVVLLWDPGYSHSVDRSVVEACDLAYRLQESIDRLLANETHRRTLGQLGQAYAQRHWSWRAAAAAYTQLYKDAIQRRG